ncbi:hypothetical protein [Hymenobacter volaticus]|uniref:Roadblock/LAMTOR2 domain-containing protein n=1 Tax=Hymenobacter volaticus TaxID=2932254 RepID=A0ABY4G1S4_9BACT|nr:hypothetical protein [Hymenobacter volaticus]UOQ64524.1 hypothetical protein MUN86_13105 [Hymenobacter volaticus]
MMFEFFEDFPPLEKILIIIFREHNIHALLSIEEPLYDPDTGIISTSNNSEDFAYLLSHPKSAKTVLPILSRYRAIKLMKMEFEGRKLISIITSPGDSYMMNIVSEALVKLGGLEDDY